MNSSLTICMAALLAGLAGQASARTPTTISLGVTPNPAAYGGSIILTVTVSPAAAAGGLEIFLDNVDIISFQCCLVSSFQSAANAAPGTHSLYATYSGDSQYLGSTSSTITLTINQFPTTTTFMTAPNPSTAGQTVTLTAYVNNVNDLSAFPTGYVTFYDAHNSALPLFSAPVGLDGTASVQTPALAPGTHNLAASYSGDVDYFGSVSPTVAQIVNQIATTTSLKAVPASSSPGQTVALTATVSPFTATGSVSFLDGSTMIGSAALNGGTASLSISTLSGGSHSLTASYGGDTNDAPSVSPAVTETVAQNATTTSLQALPASTKPGQTVTLAATVSPATATGTVTFLDGSTAISSPELLSAGTASVQISNLSGGSHSLTASYGGDTSDAPSSSQAVTVTVGLTGTTTSLKASPASSKPGQTVALTATVSPATATGTVTFLDGSTPISSPELLTSGTVSVQISTLSAGSHSLTASYAGDANDAPSVSPAVTASVGLETTTTTLAVTPTPATAGQKVTLTATVSPGDPTGTASFFDGATLLGANPLANGVATLSTSTLSSGNHSLTATYGGDANNATSTSAVVNESVTGVTGSTTPNPVSVSPASGSGSSQVMTFTFNDASGWEDLGVVNVLINNVLDGRNACYLAYSRSDGVLYLVEDDGGTLSAGLALGGAGSVSNSQCTVAGASSVATGSGNTLTLILNLAFAAGFGGNKVVYMAAGEVAGGNSGWQALGVWQAPFTPTGTIAVVSLTAARSTAAPETPQTFTATLTDSQGVGDFGVVNVLVSNFIDGRQACYLAYVASTNTLLLVDDGGDAGGPFAGSMALNGGAATIQNSQCSVNGVGSVAAKGGNPLTLILNITFQPAFAGNRIVWLAGRDAASGNNTDWQAVGTTTVQ